MMLLFLQITNLAILVTGGVTPIRVTLSRAQPPVDTSGLWPVPRISLLEKIMFTVGMKHVISYASLYFIGMNLLILYLGNSHLA